MVGRHGVDPPHRPRGRSPTRPAPSRHERDRGRRGAPWWRTPSSTRSTSAASPTPTATASATCRASAPGCPHLARPRRGRHLAQPLLPLAAGRRAATTWPTTATSTRCFGTLADADALIAEAHALGLRVIVDLVPNHTSDAARLVPGGARRAARAAASAPATSSATGGAPTARSRRTTGQSIFGGPAWTR